MNVREAVRASLRLLDKRDRRLLGASAVLQMATSVLDLIGVTLIGLVGALSMASVQGQQPPKSVVTVVSALGLRNFSEAELLGVISGAAAVVLLAKSVISPLLMARVFRFLARRQAIVSARLARELLSRPLTFVQLRSSQESAAALINGTSAATVVVLGQTVVGASEIALLALLSVALLLVDPGVAIGAIVFFALFGLGLQKILGPRVSRVGAQLQSENIASLSVVQEALGAYREITVADRRSLYADRIRSLRCGAARALADGQVFGILPKFVSEAVLVLGAFSLAAVLFATRPVPLAAGTFALFLATATRIMPSLLRLQSSALGIRGATGSAMLTYELAADLGTSSRDVPLEAEEGRESIRRILTRGYPDFVPSIEMHDVAFTYPGGHGTAIQDINMVVKGGQSVALVGRSGAGKSTLADIILGVLPPDAGEVAVGGLRPVEAVRHWPGGVAYVPQDVMLSNDSLRANVALGVPRADIDDEPVWEALRRAHLADWVHRQPDGLDTQIGERGQRISGGQRQRLGIARALFSRPRLLVLDEATSALDAETEAAITGMLEELEEDVTTVIIAHRLSTVRDVDLVVYLQDGRAQAQGSFDEVCSLIPALQRQASLMGLRPA